MSITRTLERATAIRRIYEIIVRYGHRCGLYPSDTVHTSQICLGAYIEDAKLQFELLEGSVVPVDKMKTGTLEAITTLFEKYYA